MHVLFNNWLDFILNFLVEKKICIFGAWVIFLFCSKSLRLKFLNVESADIEVVKLNPSRILVLDQWIIMPWVSWTFMNNYSFQAILAVLGDSLLIWWFHVIGQNLSLSIFFEIDLVTKLTVIIDLDFGVDLKIVLESLQRNNQARW